MFLNKFVYTCRLIYENKSTSHYFNQNLTIERFLEVRQETVKKRQKTTKTLIFKIMLFKKSRYNKTKLYKESEIMDTRQLFCKTLMQVVYKDIPWLIKLSGSYLRN